MDKKVKEKIDEELIMLALADIHLPKYARNDVGTILLWASSYGHNKLIKILLECGASTHNTTGITGRTPLHKAASNGHIETVKLLISKGADVNIKDENGWTPLHLATLNRHLKLVKLLVSKGANINTESDYAYTPLQFALSSKHTKIAEFLKSHGAI